MERTNQYRFILAFFALFCALLASASPVGTTYQARIIKPDGQALESASVNFKFTILDPVGTCILYAETFSAISMTNSSGIISFTLGSGVKSYPASATTFAQVFNNSTPSLSCDTGGPVSYSPAVTDIRKIVMQFNDGTGWQTLPAMAINAVPYAIYSSDSLRLGGVSATNYVQYSTIPTCAVSEALHYNGTSFNCVNVASGGGGSITSGDVTTALGYTPANQSSVATSFTTVSNSLSTVGTSLTTVTSTINSLGSSVTALSSVVSGLSASMAAFTNSQWVTSGSTISYTSGNVGIGTTTPGTGSGATGQFLTIAASTTASPAQAAVLQLKSSNADAVNRTIGSVEFHVNGYADGSGRSRIADIFSSTEGGIDGANLRFRTTQSGTNTISERMRITHNGKVGIGTLSPVTALDVSGGVRIGAESASCAAALAGTLRYSGGTVEYCNGTSWQAFGGSVTSSTVIAALGYTPANSATTASSFTTVTSTVNSLSSSVTALSSTVSGLTSSMAAMTSSQWVNNGANIYYSAGRVGIGTTTPIHKLDVSGVALVSGEYGGGETLAVSGAGSRMFFYPKKAAFRAGYAGADEWDDNNIGDSSIALGDSPIASGYGAISLGVGTIASGPYSVALGRYSQALGQSSVALGEAEASGDLSTAFDSSWAGGLYSVAMGSSSANADRSISIGQGSNANGFGSIAIGRSINANAMNVVAVGSYNVGNGSGTAWLSTDPIFEVGNSQNGSPRSNAMTILKNGNVGVGVLSPTAKLHLAAGTSTTASLKLTSGTLLTTPQAGTIEYDGSSLYYTDGTSARRTIATAGTSGTFSNMVTSNIYGSTASGGSLYIDSTTHSTKGNIVLAPNGGNVGIGTTTPTTKLSVVETNPTDAVISLSRPAGQQGIFAYATGSTPRWMTYVTNEPESGSNAGSNFGISRWSDAGTFLGNALLLKRDTGNILLAPTGGNVGIGVSSAAAVKLHIVNPTAAVSDTYVFRVDGLDGVNGAEPTFKIGFCQDSMSGYGATCFNSLDTTAGIGSEYVFKGNAPNQDIHFANGSIGIGSIPGSPLDIWSAASFQARIGHVSNNANDGSAIMMIRERGTIDSASAVLNNDTIGGMYFRAHDGAGIGTSNAHIEVFAGENQTATNKGSVMTFATTQNGQATRQEIMRIHSNGYVGIGNTTPNALLQVGPSGSQSANYNIYVASYRSTAGQGQYVGNWMSSDYWALGPATNTADNTLRLGIASDRTGTWSGTQDLNLAVGGNVSVGGGLNVSGTVTDNADLIPASAVLLMASCPAGWTDTGATGGGPGAATCNGVGCRMCQTPTAALVPPSAQILMESCPSGWTTLGKDTGPGAAGYVINGFTIAMQTCQSPAASSVMPKGLRFMMPSCPASWSDVGVAGSGPSIANCPASLCRVCEIPGGTTYQKVLFSGDASGTTASGPDTAILAGKGGSTSGSGGGVYIRAGSAVEGAGGYVSIIGGAASSTATGTYAGGGVSILGGNTTTSGTGGTVFISGGYSSYTGTAVYSDVYLSAAGGNVGVGVASATKLLHVQRDQNADTAILVKNTTTGTAAMSAVDLESDTNGIQVVSYGSGMSGNWGGSTIPKANSAVLRSYTTLPVSNMGIGTGSAAPLHLFTNDIPRLTVATTGYVGIGTSSPTEKLSIYDATDSTINLYRAGQPAVLAKWEYNSGTSLFGTMGSDNLSLITNSVERLHVNSLGNVGIGTSSPTTNLHVAGTTGGILKLQGTSAQGNNWIVFNNNGTDLGYVGFGSSGNKGLNLINYQNDKLSLGASGTEQVYILPSGSVGIGTSTPGQKFHVAGNIQADAAVIYGGGSEVVYSSNSDLKPVRVVVDGNASPEGITVVTGGNVGINNSAPSYTLDVNGSARATGSIAAWSDIRTKKNIKVIPDSLNKILQLRGVTFDWRNDEFPDKKFKTTRDIGVIAQEVEKVFPEAVQTAPDSYKSVAYQQLVAPLIEAVKELYYKITGVEREVASLKAENAELKQRLERLEKMMAEQQKSK